MREIMRNTGKAILLAGIAIAVGSSVAWAASLFAGTTADDTGSFSDGTNSLTFGTGNDTINMGSGADIIATGGGVDQLLFSGTSNGAESTNIVFEYPGPNGEFDLINFYDSASAGGDLLQVASDAILLQANTGDVVIQLGN